MHYYLWIDYFNLNNLVGLVKSNLKVGILYIGAEAEPNDIINYYYGMVVDGGLIAVERKEKAQINFSELVGNFQIVYEDDSSIIYQRKPTNETISFAIVIATYYRRKGNTKAFLKRTLRSISKQTYQNFKVFLIGDHYINENDPQKSETEFQEYKELLPSKQLHLENLPVAIERENCRIPGNLWSIGGANAMNHGLDLATKEGYTYYVHLDDDDLWNCFHLRNVAQTYQQFPEAAFVCTYGITQAGWLLPKVKGLNYNNFKCASSGAFHSSFGFRLDLLPYRYTTFEQNRPEITFPFADGDMLNRIGITSYKKIAIPIITCFHDYEGAPDLVLAEKEEIIEKLQVEQMRTGLVDPIYHFRTILGPDPIAFNVDDFGAWSMSHYLKHPFKTILSEKEIQLYVGKTLPNEKIMKKGGYLIIEDITENNLEKYHLLGEFQGKSILRVIPNNDQELLPSRQDDTEDRECV
jgi:glycosyltransferase involved in cell wall biosynthesis